jgi:hypothetical protein
VAVTIEGRGIPQPGNRGEYMRSLAEISNRKQNPDPRVEGFQLTEKP